MRKALLIFGGLMLAGLLALVLLSEFAPARPRRFSGDLGRALPEVPGWTRREIPIAGSSAAMASAQGILNFSQARQVLYVRGGAQLLVYVAYWEPGKVSVVDAGSHNPDSCWVNNGCIRTERRYAVAASVGGRALLPYEFGQYLVPSGGRQNVAFWHLVNGQPNRYEEQAAGWRDGLVGRGRNGGGGVRVRRRGLFGRGGNNSQVDLHRIARIEAQSPACVQAFESRDQA